MAEEEWRPHQRYERYERPARELLASLRGYQTSSGDSLEEAEPLDGSRTRSFNFSLQPKLNIFVEIFDEERPPYGIEVLINNIGLDPNEEFDLRDELSRIEEHCGLVLRN